MLQHNAFSTTQTEYASEKGEWLRAEIVWELLKKVASRCLSPFSRTILDSFGPSQKWGSGEHVEFKWKTKRTASEPVPFLRLTFHIE